MLTLNFILMVVIGLIFLILVFILSKNSTLDREKLSPFECGFSTLDDSRNPLSLRFFLVTLIFLVFDVELILLFPFVIKMSFMAVFPHTLAFVAFLVVLSLGLFLEWNQMMLEWAFI